MESLDQVQIIQEIISRAIYTAQPGWSELIINYHVDDGQSEFANSYLITVNGEIHEKSLPVPNDLDVWMRRLRAVLTRAGAVPFTSCKLDVQTDGKFDASYGYDPVDWDELVTAGWNFPEVTKLH
jgi:hypothetical protein